MDSPTTKTFILLTSSTSGFNAKGVFLRITVLVMTVWWLTPGACFSQTRARQAPTASQIRAASDTFREITQADVDRAHRQLSRAAGALNALLGPLGENGRAWRNYFRWDKLKKHAAAGADTDVENSEIDFDLYDVLERFYGDAPGMERAQVARVRRELREYIQIRKDARNPNLKESFEKHLSKLADAFARRMRTNDAASRDAVDEHTMWLLIHGQAIPTARRVRDWFAHPNLYVDASEGVLDAFAKQNVHETSPLRECILGARVVGTGTTIGKTNVELNESPHRGLMTLRFDAETYADTVAHRDPVRLYGKGYTRSQGFVRIEVDSQGRIHALPAKADACTQGDTQRIESRFKGLTDRIVVNIAWKRNEEQAPLANKIAGERAAQRLVQRLDRDVARQIDQANQNFDQQVRQPLHRRDVYPTKLGFQTTDHYLGIQISQPKNFQLGAGGAPPPMTGAFDIGARVHETMIGNITYMVFADRQMKDRDFRTEFAALLGAELAQDTRQTQHAAQKNNPANSSENGEEEEYVEIVFDDHRPVTAVVDDNVIALTIRGQQFFAPRRSLFGRTRRAEFPAVNITIRYRTKFTGVGVKFTLEGDPEILPPDFYDRPEQRLSASETALRGVLTPRLLKQLESRKEFTFSETPPLTGPLESLGAMKVVSWTADNGWISLGLSRK